MSKLTAKLVYTILFSIDIGLAFSSTSYITGYVECWNDKNTQCDKVGSVGHLPGNRDGVRLNWYVGSNVDCCSDKARERDS
ncbi:uncharacterized protein BP5553_03190 [Venustampulla echinocandica]|uniref:Secreted protein n=1 Tax=Venustampulla echinocandica TaxID=2656787 RepID=A0A370TTK2_9HELO|nr:uncharacterized protein BP5553_03190 [Venustampulla echinocandica]RDL38850.1 hypothetical protein BP5553_03190 [Venustampulla echinocandica]